MRSWKDRLLNRVRALLRRTRPAQPAAVSTSNHAALTVPVNAMHFNLRTGQLTKLTEEETERVQELINFHRPVCYRFTETVSPIDVEMLRRMKARLTGPNIQLTDPRMSEDHCECCGQMSCECENKYCILCDVCTHCCQCSKRRQATAGVNTRFDAPPKKLLGPAPAENLDQRLTQNDRILLRGMKIVW